MALPAALNSGLVGYLYRWIRNAGVVALVSGGGLLAHAVLRTSVEQETVATVSHIEIACEIVGAGLLNSAFARDVECSEAGAVLAANSHMALTSREVPYVRLAFTTVDGAARTARTRADGFGDGDLQRGDEVQIAYREAAPHDVRPAQKRVAWVRPAALMAFGLLALLLVLAARKAARFESNVDDEVAALKRAYDARTRAPRRQ